MHIQIQPSSLARNPILRRRLEERLRLSLSRYRSSITQVTLRIQEAPDPSLGTCVILSLRLWDGNSLDLGERGGEWPDLLDRALATLERSLGRRVMMEQASGSV